MNLKIKFLAVIALELCLGLVQVQAQATTNFLAATDFSDLAFFESKGITYKDGGLVQDGLQILKNHGLNCVRLRLWTSSQSQALSNPYNYINNNSYTIPLAVRAKKAGLRFSLDFHYSDTWADPGHQATPSAWTNLTFSQLLQQMRTYNSNTISAFAAAGAMPDYVQVGNEITSGMLWPSGKVSGSTNASWSQLGQLMKAAVQGIQDASTNLGLTMPKIIVHIDRGGDWATTEWFFDNLSYQGVPYDIIGESYYPFYQGDPANLTICLSNAAIRYGKPLIVAEDAFPYTNTCPSSWLSQLYGYPPTPAGQVAFMGRLGSILKAVPNQLGIGLFYWGAEYQLASGVNEAGFNTSSFFDPNGNLLPVADALAGIIGQTTIALASGANPSAYGTPVTFTATVQTNGVAVGNISGEGLSFYSGGVSLGTGLINGSGKATYQTTATQLPAGNASIAAVYGGDLFYAGSTNATAQSVSPANLAVTNLLAPDKVYDGTTNANLDASHASLSGIFSGDSVTLLSSDAAGYYADKNVGTNKPVTVIGLAAGGVSATNYLILEPTNVTGNLTPAGLTVSGITAVNKIYDGTTVAILNGSAVLNGLIPGDNVNLVASNVTASFADPGVGTNKQVTVAGYEIAGADAANYNLSQPTGLTASILPAPLKFSTISASPGNVRLKFTGPFGASYSVLASQDLTAQLSQWSVVASGTFGIGPVTFTDSPGNLSRRFYVITVR